MIHRIRHLPLIIAFLATSLLTVPVKAQYSAYRVIKTPMLIKNKKQVKITKGMKLASNDMICIKTGSELWIRLQRLGSPIFKLKTVTPASGKKLSVLIDEIHDYAKDEIRRINKTITQGIATHSVPKDAFDRAGVSHVTNSQGNVTTLKMLLGPEEVTDESMEPPLVKVIRRRDPGNLYHFAFRSNGYDGLYVNVIDKDCTAETMELLIPETILLNADTERDISECMFEMPGKYSPGVIVVVSDAPFTIDDLRKELDVSTQDITRRYAYYVIK